MPPRVFRRPVLIGLYFLFTAVFVVLGLLLLLVALGNAVETGPWSGKWLGVAGFGVAGLSWLLGTPSMWSMAQGYRRNVAKLDGAEFHLYTAEGKEIRFRLDEVETVTWDPRLREYVCVVYTKSKSYWFDGVTCPQPKGVARAIAEAAGKPLEITRN